MLKIIAMKKEIQELSEELKNYKNRNIELRGKIEEERNRLVGEKEELIREIAELQSEKSEYESKYDELENENEILRKYYDLDKEPSEEIKMKIHIDLELNRLKEENIKLSAMANRQPPFIPMPYYQYSPFWRL